MLRSFNFDVLLRSSLREGLRIFIKDRHMYVFLKVKTVRLDDGMSAMINMFA